MKVAFDLMLDVPGEIPVLDIEDYITKARKILRDYIVRELFVRDKRHALMGYIDITDVLRVTDTKSNITVKGFLKDAPAVQPDDRVESVAVAIREAGTGSVAVVGNEGDLQGVILLSELFPILITRHKLQGRVSDFMTEEVITCTPEDTLHKVFNLITESSCDAFPVERDGTLIGMVSRSDLLRKGKVRKSLGNAAKTAVESVMTTPAITIAPNDDIATAAERLIHHNISRMPVIEEGRIVGILDRHDVLKCVKL